MDTDYLIFYYHNKIAGILHNTFRLCRSSDVLLTFLLLFSFLSRASFLLWHLHLRNIIARQMVSSEFNNEFNFFYGFGYLEKIAMAADLPEEPMDVGNVKFEENIWYKKYQLLKRKCAEFEQVDL